MVKNVCVCVYLHMYIHIYACIYYFYLSNIVLLKIDTIKLHFATSTSA